MNRKKYHKGNFFKHTYCVFDERSFDEIKDFQHNFISQSGSTYFYTDLGLYRISNHWGRVANCRWRLNSLDKKCQDLKLGFAKWSNFYPNNENENLFYIEWEESSNSFTYKHKFEAKDTTELYFRTADQTAKVLKDLKEINETNTWAKYLVFDDYLELKKQVSHLLISTNKSFLEVKRMFL